MSALSATIARKRPAIATVAAFSAFALAAAVVLSGSPGVPFADYFGAIPPVVAVGLVVSAAVLSHWFLQSCGAFLVVRAERLRRGLIVAALAAPILAAPTVVADLMLGFPRDINVAPPQAFLFYPLMGYVAETAFHLVPLALLLLAARVLSGERPSGRLVRAAILPVALAEPLFQAPPFWTAEAVTALDIFMLVHLYAFSVVLLALYRYFDFVTAFAFRMVYYLFWHILWGVLRLQIMF